MYMLLGYIFAGVMGSNVVQGFGVCIFLCYRVRMSSRLISHTSFPVINGLLS